MMGDAEAALAAEIAAARARLAELEALQASRQAEKGQSTTTDVSSHAAAGTTEPTVRSSRSGKPQLVTAAITTAATTTAATTAATTTASGSFPDCFVAEGTIRAGCAVEIGRIETCWSEKNGTPRQGRANPASRGRLTLPNTDCAAGLEAYSHVWLLFWFHLNTCKRLPMKVMPPRLPAGMGKQGMLSTRTPHRFSPIGLTLARLLRVEGKTLVLAEIDIVSGTPILDVKPYVPWSDSVVPASLARVPPWLMTVTTEERLTTTFAPEADAVMRALFPEEPVAGSDTVDGTGSSVGGGGGAGFAAAGKDAQARPPKSSRRRRPKFKFLENAGHAREVIEMVLGGEPRSKYRRSHCMDKRYVFAVDALDVEVEFSGSGTAGDAACVVAVRLRGKSEIPRRSASPAGKQEEEDEEQATRKAGPAGSNEAGK